MDTTAETDITSLISGFEQLTERFVSGNWAYSRRYDQCTSCPGSPGCCGDAVTVVGRHSGTCNIVYIDGHVKAVRPSQVTSPFTNTADRGGPLDQWDRY